MHKQKAFHYLERAECFLKLMKLGRNQEIIEDYLGEKMIDYGAGAALLAVHSGISAADAILVHLTGERSTAQDHKMAVEALKKACSKTHLTLTASHIFHGSFRKRICLHMGICGWRFRRSS